MTGLSSARTVELLYSRAGQQTVAIIRRLAAVVIVALGLYFTIAPFWSGSGLTPFR